MNAEGDFEVGVYNTDGELVEGTLFGYREIARRLGESHVGFFMKSEARSVILATAVNVQKKGRRPDTLLVMGRYPAAAPGGGAGALILRFFSQVRRVLEDADYLLLNVGNDETFLGSVADHGIGAAADRERAAVSFSAGKLLAGRRVYLTSSRLRASVEHIAHTADLLIPVLHLGFSFAASRKTFESDLLVTPEKAPNIPSIDIDLDSGLIEEPDDARIFSPFTDFISDPHNRGTVRPVQTKEELTGTVAGILSRQATDPKLKERFLALSSPPGPDRTIDVREAVRAVLTDAGPGLLEQYANSGRYNRVLLREEILGLNAGEFRLFWERLAYSSAAPDVVDRIVDLFTGYLRDLTIIAPALQEKAGKGRKAAQMDMSEPPRKRRRWPFMILLILALITAVYAAVMLLGWPGFPVPGAEPAGDGLPAEDSLNRTEVAVVSADRKARLTMILPEGEQSTPPVSIIVIPLPQDFSHQENWYPISPFYKIEPEGYTFDPPASLAIDAEFSGVESGETFIARRAVINNTITGSWATLNSTVVENESIRTWISGSGLYGAFYLPHNET
jgi:hypothetical protein